MSEKYAIIGNVDSDFFSRLRKHNLESLNVELFSLKDVRVEIDGTQKIFVKENDLSEYKRVYFYAVESRMPIIAEMTKILAKSGVEVLDYALEDGLVRLDKFNIDQQKVLKSPEFTLFFSLSDEKLNLLSFPKIFKKMHGSKGSKVALVRNIEEGREFISTFGNEVIVEEFLPVEADYRLIIIDNVHVGTIKRYHKEDDFLTTRPGGRREVVELDEGIVRKSIDVARIEGLFFAGVDLVDFNGEWYCLEVNGAPQIRVFEKLTNIDVTKIFLDKFVNK